MVHIVVFMLAIVPIWSSNIPCKKLYFFGNNIHNKALLSPIILVGQRTMVIPLENDRYKATIEIKKVIKGFSDGLKRKIIVAGSFLSNINSNNLCEFNSNEEDSIFYLEVLSAADGEYNVLFNPEILRTENLEIINKTICKDCAGIPKLYIKDQSIVENTTKLDCTSESNPPSIIKWTNAEGVNLKATEIKDGARLIVKPSKDIVNEGFICTGTNLLGESTASIIIKALTASLDQVTRCAMHDKLLCNNHGKCYKDRLDGDKMFCRCNLGFSGFRCTNNPNKLSENYLVRTSEIDKIFCRNNGVGYTNVVTKTQHCICKEGFYGKNCLVNAFQQSNFKGKMARSRSREYSENEKSEIKMMLDKTFSKSSTKFIIIWSTVVLIGCSIITVAIIVVTLIAWKCCGKNKKKENKKIDDDDKKSVGTNNTMNSNNIKGKSKMEEETVLLRTKVPSDFGEGIYDGLVMPPNGNSSSQRHV